MNLLETTKVSNRKQTIVNEVISSVNNNQVKQIVKSSLVKKDLIFTTNNYKTMKGEALGYKTLILHLNPHRQNSLNVNLCPYATGCEKSCISETGNMVWLNSVNKRSRLTESFLNNRVEFVRRMISEIEYNASIYQNLAIRTNGTSDINFSKIKVNGKNIYEHFANNKSITFYNYTKDLKMMLNNKDSNHYMVFSGDNDNWFVSQRLLELGYNVALVFKDVPTEYKGFKVVHSDDHDLIFLREKGTILGLKFKSIRTKNANNKQILNESNLIIK